MVLGVLSHKSSRLPTSCLSDFSQRRPRTDQDELNAELKWACSRPGSLWNSAGDLSEVPDVSMPDAFERCFSQWELDAYAEYTRSYPNAVYAMNQNPTCRATLTRGQAGIIDYSL